LAVEERQNEVKEVALAKITRRLLLEVRATQAHAANDGDKARIQTKSAPSLSTCLKEIEKQ